MFLSQLLFCFRKINLEMATCRFLSAILFTLLQLSSVNSDCHQVANQILHMHLFYNHNIACADNICSLSYVYIFSVCTFFQLRILTYGESMPLLQCTFSGQCICPTTQCGIQSLTTLRLPSASAEMSFWSSSSPMKRRPTVYKSVNFSPMARPSIQYSHLIL